MKKIIINGIIVIAIGLVAPQTARCQGTLYVSSLGQPSSGSATVASDSWQAALFQTGNNPGGYALDSIQLAMTPASGDPNGFTAMIYSVGDTFQEPVALGPESSLGTLNGPTDPVSGGVLTYTASDVMLSPSTEYYIVLTSGTTAAGGAFAWSFASSPPSASGGWEGADFYAESSNGLTWMPASGGLPQFAVTAMAVPEPDTLGLLGVSGLLFFVWRRWQAKTQLSIPDNGSSIQQPVLRSSSSRRGWHA